MVDPCPKASRGNALSRLFLYSWLHSRLDRALHRNSGKV